MTLKKWKNFMAYAALFSMFLAGGMIPGSWSRYQSAGAESTCTFRAAAMASGMTVHDLPLSLLPGRSAWIEVNISNKDETGTVCEVALNTAVTFEYDRTKMNLSIAWYADADGNTLLSQESWTEFFEPGVFAEKTAWLKVTWDEVNVELERSRISTECSLILTSEQKV